jgi:hypothetical protein
MKTSNTLIAIAALNLSLVACAPVKPVPIRHFTRPETTQEQFMKDRYECLQEAEQRVSGAYVNSYGGAASSQVIANCGVWVACLGARGYTVDPNGNLSAPREMIVRCVQ